MKLKRIFDAAAHSAKEYLSAKTMKSFDIAPEDKVLVCEDGTVAYSKYISFSTPYKDGKMLFRLFDKDGNYFGYLEVAQNDVPDMYDDQDLADHIWGLVEHGMYHAPQEIKDYVNGDAFDNGTIKGTVENVNGDEVTITTESQDQQGQPKKQKYVVNQQTGEIKPVADSASPSSLQELDEELKAQLDDTGIASVLIPEGVADTEATDEAYAFVEEEYQGSPVPNVYVTHEPVRKLHVEL